MNAYGNSSSCPPPAIRLLVGVLLVLAVGCDDEIGGQEPFHFDGRPVRVEGRIVGPDENPLEGVRVELISPDYPHYAEQVVAVSTTGADGRFRFAPVPSSAVHHVVVSHGSSRHAHLLEPIPSDGPESHGTGDLHFAPDRELVVRARCPHPLTNSDETRGRSPIWVRLDWMGHQVAHVQLLPTDGTPRSTAPASLGSTLTPGVDSLVIEPPEDARRFERRVRVPAGTHHLRVSGGCGELTTTVEVPARGDVDAVELSLSDDSNTSGQ